MSFISKGPLLLFCSLILLPCLVSSSGVFEFRFDSFDNPLGRDQHAQCCSNTTLSQDPSMCASPCRIFFRVCLKHYQNNIDTDTPCTFGEVTTPVLGNNAINNPGYTVPIFFNFSWPKTCSYIVDVGHESFEGSRTIPGKNKLIYQLKMQTTLQVSSLWTKNSIELGYRSKARLDFAIRVTCNENYFGDQCSNYCRSRNDDHGHYVCSEHGTIICLPGWQGPGNYCKEAICAPGCDGEHGSCDRPYECKCRFGWEGSQCNQCKRYPGCLHGTCNKPFECNCKEGWGGILCNQDLNFCTNHKPCKNGGSCTNSGHGGYTCKCPPNFTGKNCEIELTSCDHEPCKNGASCRSESGNGNYTCECPLGYTGRNCESLASMCSTNPCLNGATCIMGPSGYQCICPAGDYDENNNCRKFTGCHQKPCRNDGKCSSTMAGYNCSCPAGFTGPNCEVNIDECSGVTCQNGGICKDGKNDFTCRCPPGFSGKMCQNKVDFCRGFPCANSGSCLDSSGTDFVCICTPGWTGRHCENNINECLHNPCLNQGRCEDRVNEFLCHCQPGFSGYLCQIDSNATLGSSPFPTAKDLPHHFAPPVQGVSSSPSPATDSDRNTLLISSAVGLPLALMIILILVIMNRKYGNDDREERKEEQLARSQNEANLRMMQTKCVDPDDPFKGTMIVNSLNSDDSPKGSQYHHNLNREKSLTLSKLSKSDYDSNLKATTMMRTKSNHKLVNTDFSVSANNMKSKSTSKLNALDDPSFKVVTILPDEPCVKRQGHQHPNHQMQQMDHHHQQVHVTHRHHQRPHQHHQVHPASPYQHLPLPGSHYAALHPHHRHSMHAPAGHRPQVTSWAPYGPMQVSSLYSPLSPSAASSSTPSSSHPHSHTRHPSSHPHGPQHLSRTSDDYADLTLKSHVINC